MLKKDLVIKLWKKYKSKRKVAIELGVSRQYVIQEVKAYEQKLASQLKK